MKLTAEAVNKIFIDCLFSEEEAADKELIASAKTAQGVTINAGFHPGRLEAHAGDIQDLLVQLPDEFLKDLGGGWSFINLCLTKDGEQWGEQSNAQELMLLALASGFGSYPLPRELWSVLPGGVPYFAYSLVRKTDNAVTGNP